MLEDATARPLAVVAGDGPCPHPPDRVDAHEPRLVREVHPSPNRRTPAKTYTVVFAAYCNACRRPLLSTVPVERGAWTPTADAQPARRRP
jgi:hypothetical protein